MSTTKLIEAPAVASDTLYHKKNRLFMVLFGIFLSNALVAEIVGVKIFSLENTLGLPAAQIPMFDGWILDFNLSSGVLMWPVVFITGDLINEYFGKAGVRRISVLTAMLISYSFVIIWCITKLSPAGFWVDLYRQQVPGLDINDAFSRIFAQGLNIILGSLSAFLLAQIIDVGTFQWVRRLTGSKNLWLRATGSTLVSQLIDSFVVIFIAFYILGNPAWTLTQVFSVGIVNYIYKFFASLATTPLVYLAHYLIEQYLGKQNSERLAEEASKSSFV